MAEEQVIICYERWDYEMLECIRKLDIQPPEVKKTLSLIKLVPGEDNRVMVRYSRKKGDPKGRMYGNLVEQDKEWPSMYWPRGTSLQGIAAWVRHFIAHKYYRDFDISNCAPNIMAQILSRYSLCPAALTAYNRDRSRLFDRYSRQYNIPRAEVKEVFIGILHTGKADHRFPESVRLKQQLDQALRQLKQRPEYATLYASVAKQQNPLGSFAFAVWSREEHRVLMCMRQHFVQLGYPREYMVLCFDGIMIEKNEVLDATPLDLEALATHIQQETGYRLKIEEKSLVPSVEDESLVSSFSDK